LFINEGCDICWQTIEDLNVSIVSTLLETGEAGSSSMELILIELLNRMP
jgi:hypothetical protein